MPNPIHPQWISAVLVGGPLQFRGQKITVHRSRKLIMAGELPDEDSEQHHIGHAYVNRGDGKHFDYVGEKSLHELNVLLRSGQLSLAEPDDCGFDGKDHDWWKKDQ